MFDLSDAEFTLRLSAVRRALYLLFNEGYHGASGESAVCVELCTEAMRLTALLREYPPAAAPETDALASLMCLHAARLPVRLDSAGDLNPFFDQHRSRWNGRLVEEGLALLERSAVGHALTAYHVEAAIAAAHASAPAVDRTDWALIVSLYDRLMTSHRRPSSRSIARSPSHNVTAPSGASRNSARSAIVNGSTGIRSIRPRWASWSAVAGIVPRRDSISRRRSRLARNPHERQFLEKRVRTCASQ